LYGDGNANRLDGSAGDDTLYGDGGADVLIGGTGFDTVRYTSSTSGVNVSLATGTGSGGDAAGDTYSGIEQVNGSAYADTLTGDGNVNVFFGNGGDDTLYGGAGDTLFGGTGNDTFYVTASNVGLSEAAGEGFDTVVVQTSIYTVGGVLEIERIDAALTTNNSITGSSTDNIINGNIGSDVLDGGAGNDTLNGNDGTDTLVGGAGNDVLNGGAGNDALYGGSQNDTFVFHAGFGKDLIADFTAGTGVGDVIQVETSIFADFAAIQSHAQQVGANTVITFDAADTITLQNVNLGNLAADDFWFV
jgi:Ca2+-binding RTX toxin-like protein